MGDGQGSGSKRCKLSIAAPLSHFAHPTHYQHVCVQLEAQRWLGTIRTSARSARVRDHCRDHCACCAHSPRHLHAMDDAQDERKALECLLESSASMLMSVSNMPTMLRFEYKLL